MSKRTQLTAEDLRPWSRNVALVDLGTDGCFYVRTFGIDLIRRFGRESTGHCIDDLARDVRESLQASLWRSFSTCAPVAAWSSVKLGRDAAEFCELVLPLASASLLLASYERNEASVPKTHAEKVQRCRKSFRVLASSAANSAAIGCAAMPP